MARSALVTGATGFVGGRLARLLASTGWRVTAVHRTSTSESLLEGLRERGVSTLAFEEYGELEAIAADVKPDVLFHLAAHQAKDPPGDVGAFVQTNLELGARLLEGLAGSGTVAVNAMSYSQFLHGAAEPASLYAATKQAFLVLSRYYAECRDVDVRNVILYDNYDADDPRDKLVPQLLTAVREDCPIGMGPADQTLNILHVDDVVAGLVAASGSGNPALMTVRAAELVTVGQLAELVERASGRGLRKFFDASRTPDQRPIVSGEWPLPLGWQPVWGIEDGLRDALKRTLQGS